MKKFNKNILKEIQKWKEYKAEKDLHNKLKKINSGFSKGMLDA